MAEKQYVVFKLVDGEYGIEIMQVKEIIKYQGTVKIPDAPGFIEGVINYRDSTTPVIDLAKRFNLEEKEKTDSSRIIVTNINSKHLGFAVDSVEEVLKISEESIDTVPEIMGGMDKQYINGVGNWEKGWLFSLMLTRSLQAARSLGLRQWILLSKYSAEGG